MPFVSEDGSAIREYVRTSAQTLAEGTLQPGQRTDRHYHRIAEEIYLILEGGGTLEVDGATAEVGAGEAILIPPGSWHELVAGPDGVRLLCTCVPAYSSEDTFFA